MFIFCDDKIKELSEDGLYDFMTDVEDNGELRKAYLSKRLPITWKYAAVPTQNMKQELRKCLIQQF